MEIHEYQAKQLLKDFGVNVPMGGLAYSPEQAVYRANELGGDRWVVKAQIHSGARGKAGGIQFCSSTQEVWDSAESLLGKTLVTNQTGPEGKTVYRLYVEPATNIKSELYFGLVLDRSHECIVAVGSSSGGMDIEEVSEQFPDSIVRINIEPAVGMQAFQARQLAFKLGLNGKQVHQAANLFLKAYRSFRDLDATMLEINPLTINTLDCYDLKNADLTIFNEFSNVTKFKIQRPEEDLSFIQNFKKLEILIISQKADLDVSWLNGMDGDHA